MTWHWAGAVEHWSMDRCLHKQSRGIAAAYPMTRCVADRQENGLVLLFACGEGFRTPLIPCYRVVLMLQKVGTLCLVQAVLAVGTRHGRGRSG